MSQDSSAVFPPRNEVPNYAHRMLAQPYIVIGIVVALQQLFAFWSRDLWWADEVRQIEVLRQMVESGNWIVLRLNGAFYPDKPQIYFWLMGTISLLFSSVEPPVIFLGLALTYYLYACNAYKLSSFLGLDRTCALATSLMLLSTPYLVASGHYARMDFLFSFFIMASWAAFFSGARSQGFSWNTVAGFIYASLAALTKGPFGLLMPLVAIFSFLMLSGKLARFSSPDFLIGAICATVILLIWIAMMMFQTSSSQVAAIFESQIIERGFSKAASWESTFRYLIILPVMLLPWILCFISTRVSCQNMSQRMRNFMTSGSGDAYATAILITGLFMLSIVKEKHEYYLLPLMPVCAMLIASRMRGVWFRAMPINATFVAFAHAALSVLSITAPAFAPADWQIAGLWTCAFILAIFAVAIFLMRRRSMWTILCVAVVGTIAWANILALLVMPSLDRIFSPRPIAALMRNLQDGQTSFGSYGLVPGTLSYYLRARYFEAPNIAALKSWIQSVPHPIFVISERLWKESFTSESALLPVGRFLLGGDILVVVIRKNELSGSNSCGNAE